MKKKLFVLSALFCVFFCVAFACDDWRNNIREDYYYMINSLVQDIDFDMAEVKSGKIVLYDSEQRQIDEIDFEGYNDNIDVLHIRKSNNIVYIVTRQTIDDETGIMFVNDGSDRMMDGLHSIKRVGGSMYQYNTAP